MFLQKFEGKPFSSSPLIPNIFIFPPLLSLVVLHQTKERKTKSICVFHWKLIFHRKCFHQTKQTLNERMSNLRSHCLLFSFSYPIHPIPSIFFHIIFSLTFLVKNQTKEHQFAIVFCLGICYSRKIIFHYTFSVQSNRGQGLVVSNGERWKLLSAAFTFNNPS